MGRQPNNAGNSRAIEVQAKDMEGKTRRAVFVVSYGIVFCWVFMVAFVVLLPIVQMTDFEILAFALYGFFACRQQSFSR